MLPHDPLARVLYIDLTRRRPRLLQYSSARVQNEIASVVTEGNAPL